MDIVVLVLEGAGASRVAVSATSGNSKEVDPAAGSNKPGQEEAAVVLECEDAEAVLDELRGQKVPIHQLDAVQKRFACFNIENLETFKVKVALEGRIMGEVEKVEHDLCCCST